MISKKRNFYYISSDISDYQLLKKSNLFDLDYYLDNNKDVKDSNIDPIYHFINYGWKEGRNPSKEFDLQLYIEHNIDYFKKHHENPLLHCIKSNNQSYRSIFPKVLPFDHVIKYYSIADITSINHRNNFINKNKKICVVIHLFYEEQLDYIISNLNNIQYKFDLYISIVSDNKKYIFKKIKKIKNCKKIIILKIDNIGRDIYPFLKIYKQYLYKYDYICKIHTKKNTTGNGWSSQSIKNLIGSKELISEIFWQLNNKKIGMIYPFPPLEIQYGIENTSSWNNNFKFADTILSSFSINSKEKDKFTFPAGSMFWCKAKSLIQFKDFNIDDYHLPKIIGNNNSIFHAIERIFGLVLQKNNYKIKSIKIFDPDPEISSNLKYKHISNKLLNNKIKKYIDNKQKNRILIYTYIQASDELKIPEYIDNNIDYVCFCQQNTDIKNNGIWNIQRINIASKDYEYCKLFCKYNILQFIKDYDYAIWIDSSMCIISDFLKNVDLTKDLILVKSQLYNNIIEYIKEKRIQIDVKESLGIYDLNIQVFNLKNNIISDYLRDVYILTYKYNSEIISTSITIYKYNLNVEVFNYNYDQMINRFISYKNLQYKHPIISYNVDSYPITKYNYIEFNKLYSVRISVIITVHNALSYFRKMIYEVISSCNGLNSKIIIVDDSSDDNTAEFIKQISLNSNNIFYIRNNQQLGYIKSVNIGIQKYQADYYIILNSDIELQQNCIIKLIYDSMKYELDIVSPISNSYCSNRLTNLRQINDYISYNNQEIIYSNLVYGFCICIKKEVIDKIGAFDENLELGYFDDNDFCIRAIQNKFNIGISLNTYVYHYQNKSFSEDERDRLCKINNYKIQTKYNGIQNISKIELETFNFFNINNKGPNMKTALVCIAKNEDHYIDEWIKYHLKIGFDFIYVYQNNWRYKGDKSCYNNVHWIEFDGETKQIEAYQNFINYHQVEYDWVAFFDVDEFLALRYHNNIKKWLSEFNDYYAIGVNWRLFGDSNLTEVQNYEIINRFIMAERNLNFHIKTIINLKKCRENNIVDSIKFLDPHSVSISNDIAFTIATNRIDFIHGPFNNIIDDNYTAQLNHYFCKTLKEFIEIKQSRGRADIGSNYKYLVETFNSSNKNEIKDLIAYKFFNS